MHENYIQSSWTESDETFEIPLRPTSLKDFIGQNNIKNRLEIFIGAAKKRKEILSHCLLSGPPGLGKTTLANIIAKEMQSNIVVTSGPVIEKPGDLAGILTGLKKGDILFIDEIHRLSKNIEEYLYPAMEDFSLDLLIDSGPHARSVKVKLNPFTLIGATTRSGLLSSPLRSRFVFSARLDYYLPEDLQKVITRSSALINLKIENKAAYLIAERSRGTPRIANNLLRWTRDFAQMKDISIVDQESSDHALKMLSIDEMGLDETDKKILFSIIEHFNGGPVGIKTLSLSVGEEADTISEVYEPYLILKGLLKRTLRGREVTNLAYKHLGIAPPSNVGDKK